MIATCNSGRTMPGPPLPARPPARRSPAWRLPVWRRVAAHPDAATLALGLVLAVGVCWPVLGGRPLFLLDWVSGPRPPMPSEAMLGLNGGLTTGVAGAVIMTLAVRLIGEAATWLPLLLFFPVAAVGAGRLTGGPRSARLAAATVYCANPFVFNRIFAGQLSLLVGYALLPFAVAGALRAVRRRSVGLLTPALWWAVLTAISPHFAWIYGVVLVAVAALTRPHTWRAVAWLAGCTAAFAVTCAYILLPHSATQLPTTVGTTSLDLYRTVGDPHLGLFPNVAGLYGFWRTGPGPQLPKDVVTGWPLLLVALLVVVVAGYHTVLRRPAAAGAGGAGRADGSDRTGGEPAASDPTGAVTPAGASEATANEPTASHSTASHSTTSDRRRLAWVLVAVGVAGYFLALGSQGPTGPLFRWAYDTVPFFAVMREPQKFLMLLALAYAVGFGWGVERLVTAATRSPGTLPGGTEQPGTPIPGTGQPGTLPPDTLPVSTGQPGTRAAGPGQPATGAPGTRAKRRPVVVAAVVGLLLPLAYTPTIFDGLAGQIGPSTLPAAYQQADTLMGAGTGRVLYLPWHLYEAQPFTGGRVVATLGPTVFRRLVIAGDNVQAGPVQTQSTSPRSAYLQDLFARGPAVTDFGALVAPLGVEYVVLARTVDWRSYGWLAAQRDLRLVLRTGGLDVWRNLAYAGAGHRTGSATPVQRVSPVAYRVPPGAPGTVTIDATYQQGWTFDGRPGQPTPQGTVRFTAGAGGGMATFGPWGQVRLGYVVSIVAVAALAVAAAWDHRRRAYSRDERRPGTPRCMHVRPRAFSRTVRDGYRSIASSSDR